jgi:very-short-patch-repair endonuclease
MNLKFRRQHPVGKFVLDFYCESLRVAIEVDGGIHRDPEQRVADLDRQAVLENLSIRFIRIPAQLVTATARPQLMQYLIETLSIQAGTPLPSRERGRGEGRTPRSER